MSNSSVVIGNIGNFPRYNTYGMPYYDSEYTINDRFIKSLISLNNNLILRSYTKPSIQVVDDRIVWPSLNEVSKYLNVSTEIRVRTYIELPRWYIDYLGDSLWMSYFNIRRGTERIHGTLKSDYIQRWDRRKESKYIHSKY